MFRKLVTFELNQTFSFLFILSINLALLIARGICNFYDNSSVDCILVILLAIIEHICLAQHIPSQVGILGPQTFRVSFCKFVLDFACLNDVKPLQSQWPQCTEQSSSFISLSWTDRNRLHDIAKMMFVIYFTKVIIIRCQQLIVTCDNNHLLIVTSSISVDGIERI